MTSREISGESGIPALLLTASAASDPEFPNRQMHLAVHALAPAAIRSFEVAVTGHDIPTPLTASLVVDDDRVARGHLCVPVGDLRRIEIEARNGDGVATHLGAVSLPLLPGGHPPLQLLLTRV